jgi:hypothetical protein
MQDPIEQPIQFDHRHHTRDEGIDCRFCHSQVDRSPHAGRPVFAALPQLPLAGVEPEPAPRSRAPQLHRGRPIVWQKVNDVPDFVYFNHSIHVNKGVGCVTLPWPRRSDARRGESLSAHHELVPQLSPQPRTVPAATRRGHQHGLEARGDAALVGKELAERNQVHTRTSCSTCHR